MLLLANKPSMAAAVGVGQPRAARAALRKSAAHQSMQGQAAARGAVLATPVLAHRRLAVMVVAFKFTIRRGQAARAALSMLEPTARAQRMVQAPLARMATQQ